MNHKIVLSRNRSLTLLLFFFSIMVIFRCSKDGGVNFTGSNPGIQLIKDVYMETGDGGATWAKTYEDTESNFYGIFLRQGGPWGFVVGKSSKYYE